MNVLINKLIDINDGVKVELYEKDLLNKIVYIYDI